MATVPKRITVELTDSQHEFITKRTKSYSLTQAEVVGLMVDVMIAQPKALEPHLERMSKRKALEAQRQKDMERKAQRLVNSLTPEQQEKLLSGKLDLSKLL